MLTSHLLQIIEDGRAVRSYIIRTYYGRIASITDCSGTMSSDSEGAYLSSFIGEHIMELTSLLKDKVLLELQNGEADNYIYVMRGRSVGINRGARTWTKKRFKTYYSLFRKYRDKIIGRSLSSDEENEILGVLIEDNLDSFDYWGTTELFNWFHEYFHGESSNIVGPHVLSFRKKLRENGKKVSIRYKDGQRRVYIHPRGTYVNSEGEIVLSKSRH